MSRDTFAAKGTPVPGATKIVIHIEGGCLRSVFADGPLEVKLLDQDNYEGDSTDAFEKDLEGETDGLDEVW